jgi:hypothetical protein
MLLERSGNPAQAQRFDEPDEHARPFAVVNPALANARYSIAKFFQGKSVDGHARH